MYMVEEVEEDDEDEEDNVDEFDSEFGSDDDSDFGEGGGGGGRNRSSRRSRRRDEWGEDDDSEEGGSTWTPRCFISVPMLHDPHLASVQYASFFHACRLKGVFFDLERKKGTAFNLLDSFSAAVLGILCVGVTEGETLGNAVDTVDFLIKQIGASLPGVHSKAASVSSIMRELEVEGNMRGVLTALRTIQRSRPIR